MPKISAGFGRRRGATAIEYGIIAALIIVCLIAVLSETGADMQGMYTRIGNVLSGNTGPTYPGDLPYQGLGIAPPTGPVTSGTNRTLYNGSTTKDYHYANGALYSEVDIANTAYTVYTDGFTLSPAGQSPGGTIDPVTWSTFQKACGVGNSVGGGGTGYDWFGGDYSTGGKAYVAPNGDWVCSGVHLVNTGTYTWGYYDFVDSGATLP